MIAYREENAFWSQKSRKRWLKEGDSNSKYFHASVKANRFEKVLEKLLDVIGIEQRLEASKMKLPQHISVTCLSPQIHMILKVYFKASNPE